MFKKSKRVVGVHERYTRILQDDTLWLAPVSTEHMRPEEPRVPSPAPTPIEQHFFEWEMSPLSPKPKIINRRASDLNRSHCSLMDAFGSFYPVDFQDENPFEPTPLSNSSGMLLQKTFVRPKLERKSEEERWPSFEPRPLLDRFQALRSINDIPTFDGIFAPDLDDCGCLRQFGDVNCLDFGPNITASFAA